MRVALTGATGIVGGAVLRALCRAGHGVTTLDRAGGWTLGASAPLAGREALIHCAFAHAPGRYRGGEGDDPRGFVAANLDGTRRLFDDALRHGVGRVLFLSSRAVHDGHPPGSRLPDDLPARPTTLYGEVKAGAEAHLAALPLSGTSLRATGVYGPGAAWKWKDLFDDHRAGLPVAPRVATEVHVDDLAHALMILLDRPDAAPTLNCSDLVLDRRDLLALAGIAGPLPPQADASALRTPECAGLRSMGWRPGGTDLLAQTVAACLRED